MAHACKYQESSKTPSSNHWKINTQFISEWCKHRVAFFQDGDPGGRAHSCLVCSNVDWSPTWEKKSPSLSRSRQVLWHMRHHMGYCWIVGLNLALAKAVLSKRYFELFSYSLQELIKYHMKQSANPSKAFWISMTGKKKGSELFNIYWPPLRCQSNQL